jgi:osmotically-inducible protein OsmY
MTRRYEDDFDRSDDDWQSQRERNERRLRFGREGQSGERSQSYGGSQSYGERGYGGYGVYGERGASSYGERGAGSYGNYGNYDERNRGYYSQQVAEPRRGDSAWERERPWNESRSQGSGSRWNETSRPSSEWSQGFGISANPSATPRGGFSGKGPRGYTRSDDRVREDVCDRLSWDDEVDASDITVTVSQGEVTLEGSVPDRHSKRRAEDIAENVMGVKDVHNRLKANKGLMQEVGDKLMGRETEEHGHAGSGTRNQPNSTGSSGYSNAENNR